jgi:D-alanyl-D-alanine carboxypeptidase
LFTATTILRAGLDLDEKVKVQGKSGGRFPRGLYVTRSELLRAMLISSDNLAAESLAHSYPGGFNKFILDTNTYVQGMGLINTKIVDSTGLLPGDVSTATELIKFLAKIKDNEIIRKISNLKSDTVVIPKGKKTIRINLHNTNPSVFTFDNILISKTGFTSPAGRCVVMLVEKNGTYNAVIVLGQKNVKARSRIANDLITADPLEKPKEEQVNVVRELYGQFTAHQISDKIAQMLKPKSLAY